MREVHTLNSSSAAVKKRLDYPVIDADAHVLECEWALMDYVKDIGGPKIAAKFEQSGRPGYTSSHRSMFWAAPSGKYTIDRATCMLPKLYAERLEDAGIDFAIVYTTYGISANQVRDDEMRQVLARSLNTLYAEMFDEVKDRMTPSAVVPTWTPKEAIDELEYCVNTLGLKTVTISGEVRDAVPEVAAVDPKLGDLTQRVTSICMEPRDGNDYDPFWQRLIDLKVLPAGHSGAQKTQRRQSPNCYSFNRLGTFSVGNEFFARSLFFSGVLKRFPQLNVAFLEGGVAWASQLYNDLMEIFEKRNLDWIYEHQDPSKLDIPLMEEMFERYGHMSYMTKERWRECQELPQSQINETRPMNDFEASGVSTREEIRDQFIPNFYYGAEADDKMTALAFNEKMNHFGVKLKAIFSSDIGHWDVPDMSGVLHEAWEMVEHGTITEDDFRLFVFENTAEMHYKMNPDFYKGTVVEDAVTKLMAGRQKTSASAAE
jgi:predicted TIM-barrel fold metal-dependent hydrolase